jgi:hypothetical protein
MNEVFIPIHEYLGLYEVSNFGTVRSISRNIQRTNKFGTTHLKRYHSKVLAAKTNHGGYVEVSLWKENKGKTVSVHRAVLEAFNPTRNPLLEVNHIDGNKQNNRLDNLEWVTSSQNKIHRYLLLRQKQT